MVGPPVSTPDRLRHQHVPLISPPVEDIAQQVPLTRPRMHPCGPLSLRQTEERVRQDEAVFCAGSEKQQAVAVAAAETTGTQHSSPGKMVYADAGVEVTKDNQLVRLRHGQQEGVQVLVEIFSCGVVAGHRRSVGGALRPEPEVPSTSTAVGNQSLEREMPILNSETSAESVEDMDDTNNKPKLEENIPTSSAGWGRLQTEKDASVAQSEILKSIQRKLKSARKKLDKLVHNRTVHHEEFRQHCALMVEKRGQIHASTVLVGQRPPALPLPLCTEDAYEDFDGKPNRDADFRAEVVYETTCFSWGA
nr:unnamed protein product [Spirometra erinaceieuropaei]